jgi:YD repeat-containing protein
LARTAVYALGHTKTLDNGQSTTTSISYDSGFTNVQPVCTTDPNVAITCENEGGAGAPPQAVPLGRQIDESVSDFGGAPLRDTKTAYLWQSNPSYLTANILDATSSVTVYDGLANLKAQTTNQYDQGSSCLCGNLTSVTKLLSGGTSPVTNYAYNSAGMLSQLTDPNGNVTKYFYDSTGAFLNQIQYPATPPSVAHNDIFAFDPNTGLMTLHTDQNGQLTSYHYNSMARLINVSYPDKGNTTYCYSDDPTSSCYTPALPPVFTTSKLINNQSTVLKKTRSHLINASEG